MKILCKNSCVFENRHFSFFFNYLEVVFENKHFSFFSITWKLLQGAPGLMKTGWGKMLLSSEVDLQVFGSLPIWQATSQSFFLSCTTSEVRKHSLMPWARQMLPLHSPFKQTYREKQF